jgi:hypothetical protein
MGDEAMEVFDADPLEEWEREKTELTGEAMLMEDDGV